MTVFVSCGLRRIRENPARERSGVSTLLTSSRNKAGQLRHLLASGVGHINGDLNIALAAGCGRLHNEMIVMKRGVTQAESKWKKRTAIVIHIFVHARRIEVIEVRQLPRAAWKRDGQPAGRVVFAEKRFSDGLPAELPRIPRFKNRRDMLLRPSRWSGAAHFRGPGPRACQSRRQPRAVVPDCPANQEMSGQSLRPKCPAIRPEPAPQRPHLSLRTRPPEYLCRR